ncbi:MAG TPA: hypothetical protein VN253_18445 [Kofleriaceae bacterium]|nr:hypothetical protein [Kofleriaceae bacterium]
MRYLQIAHALPGRTRLRCPALRAERAHAGRVADALAAMPGVREVKVRPFTGSILVDHDASITGAALVDVAQRVLACDRVLAHGERPPVQGAVPKLSKIAKLAAAAFREADRDVLRASEGSLDLGTLTTLAFLGAGAAQLAFDREMDLPPWFNLAWWGYRTFMTNEQAEIRSLDEPGENPPGPGSPPITS